MAIGPEVLYTALARKVEEAETKIDQRLTEKAASMGFNSFLSIKGTDIPKEVIEILRPKYIAAGWSTMSKGNSSYDDNINFTFVMDNSKLASNVAIASADVSYGKRKITIETDK